MIKNGNVTAYSYDSMGRPTVTSTGSSSVTNAYQNDLLSTITHTNTSSKNTVYTLSYGPADLLTGVKVGSRNLVTNQYTSGRWTLARQSYGNGDYWKYSYNNSGNILSRTEYDYDGSNTRNPETVNYSYTDSTWGDLLTAYDGQAITYDGIGNPLSYRGWTMSWQGGRQLASMTGVGSSLSFDYGESGLRLSKTCTVDDSSTVHTYTWNGSLLSSDICGNTALYFHYDANGSPMGFTLVNSEGSTEYFYVKNLQGDILKVIDAAGTVHASYTYDAWGNILSSSGTLASINPLRYRGYYYDAETGLYYVSTRYYDPEICRFINPDNVDLLGANGDFASLNLFVYCGNNPITRADDGGEFWTIVGGALLGGAISAGFEIVSQIRDGATFGTLDWSSVAIEAASGALIGGVLSAGLPSGVLTAAKATINAGTEIAHGIHERKNPREIIIRAGLSATISMLADETSNTIAKNIYIGKHERISGLRKVVVDYLKPSDNHISEIAKELLPEKIFGLFS